MLVIMSCFALFVESTVYAVCLRGQSLDIQGDTRYLITGRLSICRS
jgi:hypothetical protein